MDYDNISIDTNFLISRAETMCEHNNKILCSLLHKKQSRKQLNN